MLPNPSVRLLLDLWERAWLKDREYWRKASALVPEPPRQPQRPLEGRASQPHPVPPRPAGGPPDAEETRLRHKAEECRDNLKLIERTLKQLDDAKRTSSWSSDQLRIGVHRSPNLLQRVRFVSRGEKFTLLDVPPGERGWAKVRAGDVTGWVLIAQIRPRRPLSLVPTEQRLKPGTARGGGAAPDEVEIAGRG